MHILVTGGAGFIGSHTVERLIQSGVGRVAVMDQFNDFYNPVIKRANAESWAGEAQVFEGDITDGAWVREIFQANQFDVVIHLAARAGVRPSIVNPGLYLDTNIRGTYHLLEAAKETSCKHFIFASSSSVYGVNAKVPFAEEDPILKTISPYAMTKMAGEQLCSNYSHLYGMRTLCLRFFTVYGPRQRPDLAISKFTRLIEEGSPIEKYGDGHTKRDYTYVSDIVDGIMGALHYQNGPLFDIINLGGAQTVSLNDLIQTVEASLGKKAQIQQMPEQPGDVPVTSANVTKAVQLLGFRPTTPISEGVPRYVEWFRQMRQRGVTLS